MQASSVWTPPGGTLGGIVAEARQRAEALESSLRSLEDQARSTAPKTDFGLALCRTNVAVIAEVKRRSPSKGWINAEISAPDQAAAYELGGAAAVSVLTEPRHFGGSNADLLAVGERVGIPTLKKDFHVAPVQLVEARALGASAALLIARALSPDDLAQMLDVARELELETLVEIRDEAELERALRADARIIGINNRNLETLVIDLETSERLLGMIPADRIAIAESGVQGVADVERYARSGADAVLVGSVISAANDAAAVVQQLASVPRKGRAN